MFVLVGAGLLWAAVQFSRADAVFGAVAAVALVVLMMAGVLASRRQVRHARMLASGIAHAGETIAVTFVPVAESAHRPREILDITPAGPRFAVPTAGGALR
jgi:multisubunit Na+/H+ antiporter MnhE subunit